VENLERVQRKLLSELSTNLLL